MASGLCVSQEHKFHEYFMTLVPPSIALGHKSQFPTNSLDLGLSTYETQGEIFKRTFSAHEIDVSAECRRSKPLRAGG